MNEFADASMTTLTRRAFWYLRHGETDWNARGLSQGSVDVPLNETGIAQAHAAAATLRPRGIASLLSSPLSRAPHTAEIVAEALGLPVTTDDALREVAFGVKEGQPMSAWFDRWVEGDFTPEGAETFTALRRRAVAVLNRVLEHPAPVLVVSHGALFRALRAEMGLPPNVRTPNGVPFRCEPGTPWTLTQAEG
jgi:probable phosphoglycerate mutase